MAERIFCNKQCPNHGHVNWGMTGWVWGCKMLNRPMFEGLPCPIPETRKEDKNGASS